MSHDDFTAKLISENAALKTRIENLERDLERTRQMRDFELENLRQINLTISNKLHEVTAKRSKRISKAISKSERPTCKTMLQSWKHIPKKCTYVAIKDGLCTRHYKASISGKG